MNDFLTIIAEADIQIHRMSYEEFVIFSELNGATSPKPNCRGRYFHSTTERPAFIVVRNDIRLSAQIATLLHELGHHNCVQRKCGCYTHSPTTCEVHATMSAISQMILKGLHLPLAYELHQLHKFIAYGKKNQLRTQVAKYILRQPLYRRALNSVQGKLTDKQRQGFDKMKEAARVKLPLDLKHKLQYA